MTGGVLVSAIIPTLNGAGTLPPLLEALEQERGRPLEIVAIDSGSTDATLGLLRKAGARVLDLGGAPFGHGSARNRAAAAASGSVLLLLTQDVAPAGGDWLEPLLAALEARGVAGAFGRQVPRGASPEEEYLALTNYGPEPRRIAGADITAFGPGATFFSSAFGALRREVWERIPFPDIVMSEDQAWGLEAVRAGYELRYVPQAAVYHGHDFPLVRAFRRNFDSGSSLASLGLAGGSWSPGLAHLRREVAWIRDRYGLGRVPRTLLYEAVRMTGFQLGRAERVIPRALGRLLGEAPRR